MSQDLESEEGTRRPLLGEPCDGTNSDSITPSYSSLDILIGCCTIYVQLMVLLIAGLMFRALLAIAYFCLVFVFATFVLIEGLIRFAKREKKFLLVCVTVIILDPLFFYIPVMNDEKKCIKLDITLGITVSVLRSVFDFLKIIYINFALRTEFREKGRKSLLLFLGFVTDILATLPIPQVLVFCHTRGTDFLYLMTTLFLLQYLMRVFRTYYLFTKATGGSGILAESTWAIVTFNLLLYMHGGHVFGALWYFFAIEKTTACWKKACINQTECYHSSFYCDGGAGDYKFLNDFCAINTGNTTNYNFGLYKDALQSGIVEMTDFPKRFLYCLQWGLQNLSAFGQNLQTSTDIWEIIFAICMTNFGVVLFVFLIGKMQSDTERSQKIKQMWQEIKLWQNFKDISSKVQEQIRKDNRNNWQETRAVDVDTLINNLPEDTGKKLKREIGRKLLKNVREFENWSEKTIGDLCDCLKPVFFTERTRIIRERDPIDEMIFVLKGKLSTYSYASMNVTTASMLIQRRSRENLLEDGDYCGQELIAWAQNPGMSHLPVSNRTIQALTNVEAFTLLADDLKRVTVLRHFDQAALLLKARWRFKRLLLAKRNPQKNCLESLLDKTANALFQRGGWCSIGSED